MEEQETRPQPEVSPGVWWQRFRPGRVNPLEWSDAGKCLFVACTTLPFAAANTFMVRHLIDEPQTTPYLEVQSLTSFLVTQDVAVVVWSFLLLVSLAFWLWQRRKAHRGLVNATAQLFAIGNASLIYYFGALTSPAILSLSGGTVAAGVLFGVGVAAAALASGLSLIILFSLAAQWGWLPYAPLMAGTPVVGGRVDLWWFGYMGGSSLGFTAITLGLFFLVLVRSRLHERAFQLSEERYRDLVESSNDLIQSLGPDGRILYVNPAWCRLLGYTAEEAAQLTLEDFIHPESLAHCREVFQSLMEGNEVGRIEADFVTRSGRRIPVEGSVTVQREGEKTVLTRGIFRDVSERREVDRFKDDFIATVSHEIRTPLTSIRGSLGLIAGEAAGPLGPKARRLVEIAESNSERLLRLLNDLLDVQKIKTGKMEFQLRSVDLAGLTRQAIESSRPYATESGTNITFFETSAAARVRGDPDRLTQVLMNLLSNAIKYGGRRGPVEVSLCLKGGMLCVCVRDRGPGITEKHAPHIFERFYQADVSPSRRETGTGLGLAISKAIVEEHGGRIGFKTTLGEGSTFFFEIPVAGV